MGGRGMTLHRFAAKRDANEAAIVQVLERRGYCVDRVSAPGFPDLVVSRRGSVWFVEVKAPDGTLTPKQVKWRSRWQGPPVYTLRTVEDAIAFPREVEREQAA